MGFGEEGASQRGRCGHGVVSGPSAKLGPLLTPLCVILTTQSQSMAEGRGVIFTPFCN